MPPCAATVWLRVGNTLVMQAVDRPGFGQAERGAQARAAGADHDDVVGVIDEFVVFVMSCQDLSASTRMAKIAGDRGGDVHEGGEQQQRGLGALAVHVVFDDHLHAELGMPGEREHQQDREHRDPGLA